MARTENSYAVFLDIDGTLISDSFRIPQENLDAIDAARALGHKVFINTGRSWGNIPDELREQFNVDGVIAGSGAMIIIDGETVYKRGYDSETVRKTAEYFFENRDCWCVFEGLKTNYIIANAGYKVRDGRQIELKSIGDLELFLPDEEIQVIAAGEHVPDEFMARFKDEMSFFVMRTYVDFVIKGCGKAKGIEKVLELTGIARENTIAIGDSSNDLEMLEYAGISVAMGNSQEHILGVVDYVTDTAENAGVAKAIRKYLL